MDNAIDLLLCSEIAPALDLEQFVAELVQSARKQTLRGLGFFLVRFHLCSIGCWTNGWTTRERNPRATRGRERWASADRCQQQGAR